MASFLWLQAKSWNWKFSLTRASIMPSSCEKIAKPEYVRELYSCMLIFLKKVSIDDKADASGCSIREGAGIISAGESKKNVRRKGEAANAKGKWTITF